MKFGKLLGGCAACSVWLRDLEVETLFEVVADGEDVRKQRISIMARVGLSDGRH